MGGRWLYSCNFVGCCPLDLFKIARSILVKLPSSFISILYVSLHVVHPYISIDTTAAWKKLRFILSVRSDFHMTDNLSLAVHAFANPVSMSFSVDETLLPLPTPTPPVVSRCSSHILMYWYLIVSLLLYIFTRFISYSSGCFSSNFDGKDSYPQWVECSPMVQETWLQSKFASYQILKKCYLILPCLKLSNIRYVSKVKWSNPRKRVPLSPTPRCGSY